MKHLERVMSVVLAACLLAGPMPGRALAAEEGGVESVPAAEETVPGAEEDGTAAEEVGTAAEEVGTATEEDGTAAPAPEDTAPSEEDPAESGAAPYAAASSGTCGENLVWTLDEAGTLTISGTGEMEDYPPWCGDDFQKVVITEGVTSIGYGAFSDCTALRSITIPASVISIGYNAFYHCTSLTGVRIPEGVTSIGPYAFCLCTGLTGITIPGGVKSIGYNAFSTCTGLTDVTILEGVQSIGREAFSGCTSLASVTIPKSVEMLGERVFGGCTLLTTAGPVGDGKAYPYKFAWTEAIPEKAFAGCAFLTSVTLPETVTSIGDSAFSYCAALESITIPKSVTSIGYEAFYSCEDLKAVTISKGVETVGNRAFAGCTALESIALPDSVTSIGDWAFSRCAALTSVVLPESVKTIGGSAFNDCTGLKSAGPIGGEYNYQFGWKDAIPDNAFYGCTGLESVTIPKTVKSIGGHAFSGCTGLESIAIPEGVTSIGNYAFSDCTGLAGITIPEGITSISEGMFSGCTGLKGITIPKNVKSIGFCAFYECSGLTGVTIPEGVTSIEQDAFYCCTGLENITIPGTVASIGSEVFLGATGLESVTIQKGVKSIGSYAFSGCEKLSIITIPEGVESIGSYAFSGCKKLSIVTISDRATLISYDAFLDCTFSLCIYCLPNSDAQRYAIRNKIAYKLLQKDDSDAVTWLAVNVPSGVTVGGEFWVRAGYSALNVSRVEIDLPNGIELISVWLDGGELTAGSYTRGENSLAVPVSGLADYQVHTVYLYCRALSVGSHSIGGQLAMNNETACALGKALVEVKNARIAVPERVGTAKNILATGTAAPNKSVTLFVDGKPQAPTTTNKAGSWKISFDLDDGVEDGSVHAVYAEIALSGGSTVTTETVQVTYYHCGAKPVKITMYNTGDRGAQETVFDFTNPEEANLIRYYRIWPSRYPTFTFRAAFEGNASTLGTVSIVTVSSAGVETRIPAVYDQESNSWVGARDYTDFQNAPVKVYVEYTGARNRSGTLSAVPIMDPSGYVYEAVPSNRLAGVTAAISKKDGESGTVWNAAAYDQVNPQTTGPDGSYYWDVPAGEWQVSFHKEGYRDTATDWLPVPPPQVDINVAMVSKAAPEVRSAAAYEDYAEITFSQYMDIGSVQAAITLNGTRAAVEALDAEYDAEGSKQYATRFSAAADGLLSGQVTLAVSKDALNYAGTPMGNDYTYEFSVKTRPTGIDAPETVKMVMSASQSIQVTLAPGLPNQPLTVENLTPAIIETGTSTVTTGTNGGAGIPIKALLPGTGLLRITEPASGLEKVVSIQVESGAAPETFINASIAGGVLTYEVQNLPQQQAAKLVIAGYDGRRMCTVDMPESLEGTLALSGRSTGSYVLFLAEPGTMKPLCSSFPVLVRT